MLVGIFTAFDQFVLVANQEHDTLDAVLSHSTPSLDLLLHPSCRVGYRVSLTELTGQVMVGRCARMCATHWAIRLEVVRGVVIGIKFFEVDIPAGVFHFGSGGCIGPLRHA